MHDALRSVDDPFFADGFWVFGYGSLLWNPGFPFECKRRARLEGYARSFCMWSVHHRGSPECPGLVLALDLQEGAFCDGMAFHVSAEHAAATLQELRERELVSSAYVERLVQLSFEDATEISAVAYVIDPDHAQYTGGMSLQRQADVIARATGGRGPNAEYLFNTAAHLSQIDMEDPELAQLALMVRERLA